MWSRIIRGYFVSVLQSFKSRYKIIKHYKAVAETMCHLCEWSVPRSSLTDTGSLVGLWKRRYYTHVLELTHTRSLLKWHIVNIPNHCKENGNVPIGTSFPRPCLKSTQQHQLLPYSKWIQLLWTVFMSRVALTFSCDSCSICFPPSRTRPPPPATRCLREQRRCDISQHRCRVAMRGGGEVAPRAPPGGTRADLESEARGRPNNWSNNNLLFIPSTTTCAL